MTDFKANGEGIYEVLKKQMKPYRNYFCSVEDGVYQERAVLFFISGNRPLQTLPSNLHGLPFWMDKSGNSVKEFRLP